MSGEKVTFVDFVTESESSDTWALVLVEEGPWSGATDENLRRVQERLYGCIDAVIDGKLAEQFPRSRGKEILIRLDCYNVPAAAVSAFFGRFTQGVFADGDYQAALEVSEFAREISFAISVDSIN